MPDDVLATKSPVDGMLADEFITKDAQRCFTAKVGEAQWLAQNFFAHLAVYAKMPPRSL